MIDWVLGYTGAGDAFEEFWKLELWALRVWDTAELCIRAAMVVFILFESACVALPQAEVPKLSP